MRWEHVADLSAHSICSSVLFVLQQFDDHRMDDDEDALNELLEQEQREGNSQTQNLLSASTPYPKTKPQEDASNVSTRIEKENLPNVTSMRQAPNTPPQQHDFENYCVEDFGLA